MSGEPYREYKWVELNEYITPTHIADRINERYYPRAQVKPGKPVKQLLKLSTTWGISHLGYSAPPQAKNTIRDIKLGKPIVISPLIFTQWKLTKAATPGSSYILCIWKPGLFSGEPTARLTIAKQLRRWEQAPIGSNPQFSFETALELKQYESYGCSGIPVWTEQVEDELSFSNALRIADNLLRSTEELDVLLALGASHARTNQ